MKGEAGEKVAVSDKQNEDEKGLVIKMLEV